MLPRGSEPDHELFRYLGEPEIARLRERLEPLAAGAGEILVEQGDHSTKLFVIEEGTADIVSVGQTREELVNRLGPGQVFGEVALVDGSPRTARVRASTDMRLLVMTREDFLDLADHEPALFARISLAMLESLCRKFRESLAGHQ